MGGRDADGGGTVRERFLHDRPGCRLLSAEHHRTAMYMLRSFGPS